MMKALPYYEEEWRDIAGYEGLYQVSSFGRVRSLDHIVKYKNRLQRGCIKKLYVHNGYLTIGLSNCCNGRITYLVHRLVAKTFLPNPDNKQDVDHISGIKTDNRVENLRWATRKENINNPSTNWKAEKTQFKSGTKYETAPKSIPILQYDLNGILVNEWCSIQKAVDTINKKGCTANNICHCLKGRQRTAGGYIWRYK